MNFFRMISEPQIYLFGYFAFDAGEKILRREKKDGGDGGSSSETIPLQPKTCELLGFFIENAGRLVSKNELLETIWSDAVVEESNLTHHVAALRRALGENTSGSARFVETVPRKGYRFVAPVVPREQYEFVVTEKTRTRLVEEEIESPENQLIGREREIAVIKNLLRRKDTRILTLTGVGGAGKTSLARAVMREISGEFAGGATFVDLSAIDDLSLVVPIIAQHLKIKSTAEENLLELVAENLRAREVLLILDNFEQIVAAAPSVALMADGGARSKILITSRARLRLRREYEFSVPPLEVPTRENLPEELIECAAVRLFVERGRLANERFELADENAAAIAEICRRLEGLPLAVELAAARLRLLAPVEILRRLGGQLNFLNGGARDAPARQQTMRAAIAWSYDLLNAPEKCAFETLAVFAGDFSIEAAEFLLGKTVGEAENPAIALDIIESLTEQNLIQKIAGAAAAETRFRLLEAIREFASEKLKERGVESESRRVHAEYFFGFAERSERERRGENQSRWLPKLKAENDNLRHALAFLMEHDAEKALQMAVALHVFWSVDFRFEEGRRHLAEALAKTADAPTATRGFACKGAAMLAWKQGDYEAARGLYAESLKIGELLGDKLLIAVAKNGLGIIFYLENDNRAAKRLFKQSLALSRKLGDEILTHSILTGLGEIARVEEDYSAVRRYNGEVAECARRRGDANNLCGSLLNLAAAAFLENDFASSEDFYREAAALAAQLKSDVFLSICLDGFAALAVANNPRRARLLSGAAENLRACINYKLEAPDRTFREKYVARLEKILASAVFDANIEVLFECTVEEATRIMLES